MTQFQKAQPVPAEASESLGITCKQAVEKLNVAADLLCKIVGVGVLDKEVEAEARAWLTAEGLEPWEPVYRATPLGLVELERLKIEEKMAGLRGQP